MWDQKNLEIIKSAPKLKLFSISSSTAIDYLGCKSSKILCPSDLNHNG